MRSIETVGIPGSGKSTINKMILKENKDIVSLESLVLRQFKGGLQHKLLMSVPIFKKILVNRFYAKNTCNLISQFMIQNPSFFKFVYDTNSFVIQSEVDQVFANRWMLRLVSDYQSCINEKANITLFDEGFIHKCTSLFISPSQVPPMDDSLFADVKVFLAEIPLPECVVFVDIDIENAYSRLEKRGFTTRTRNKTKQEIIHYLDGCQQIIKYALAYLDKSGVEVVRIDNNGSEDTLKKSLENSFRCQKK